MTNPDPAHITDEMWRLWTERPNPNWKLGGIYADKPGYHNTVVVNKKKWPGNYSTKLLLDTNGLLNKARAIDYTMSDIEMRVTTQFLRLSAQNPLDNRLAAVREFYGTADNVNVYGLIKDSLGGPWERSSSDKSHLWHIHISIFTAFVNKWEHLEPILSVLRGESYLDWKVSQDMAFLPKLGDEGEDVKYWQHIHNIARKVHENPVQTVDVDGVYGPAMAAAMTAFYRKFGGTGTYKGEAMTSWMGMKYHESMMKVTSPPVEVPVIDPEEMRNLVNEWLAQNVNERLVISGNLSGKVELA